MANKITYPALQAIDGFSVTPNDSNNLVLDAGNTKQYEFAFIHNAGASAAFKVRTLQDIDITVYILQGAVFPLAVKRVWATGSPASDIIALVGNR